MNGYGAANTRPRRLRPLGSEPPATVVHPDDAHAEHQDFLWGAYENEQAKDRLLEHSGLNGMSAVSVTMEAARESGVPGAGQSSGNGRATDNEAGSRGTNPSRALAAFPVRDETARAA